MQPLNQFLGFSFAQEMICAKRSSVFAWIQTTRGVRNLFIARAPDFTPIQITNWHEDDGQVLSGLTISDDGSNLLVIRGEGKNDLNEYPNPLSSVTPPKQALWLICLSSDEAPREIAETGLACFRPGSPEIYYVKKGKLFCLDTSAEEAEPVQTLSTRGSIAALSWTEQGDRLIININRHKHAFLALFTQGSEQLQWLDPSYDRDCQPIWSPDGQQIAFLRCYGGKPDIADFWFSAFSDRFELRVMDVSDPGQSVTSQPLWKCPEHQGLSLQEGNRRITWIDNEELIFSHDAEGFDHIYRANIKNHQISALTKGDYLVHSYSLSLNNLWLYYTHNDQLPHHYALSRINLDSGDREDLQPALPDGAMVFHPATAPDGHTLGLVLSSDKSPLAPAFIKLDEMELIHHQQSDYQRISKHFVDVEEISLKAPDGLQLYGQLFKPTGKGPHPALLTMHGGPWCQTLAGFSPLHGLSYAYAYCQYLAQMGFVVFSVNYRGSSGYGKSFRQPGPYFWNGACEYQDILTAGYWLTDQDDVDAEQIGVWGKSYGGYLTAMSLARNSNLFKAGVDIEGCHHIPRELRQAHWGSKRFTPEAGETLETIAERSRIALESSPWYYLDSWTSPVLLVHPDDDRNVHFEESQALFDELRKRGVAVEGLVIPDEVHSFLRYQPWETIYQQSLIFFQKYFKTR